MDKSFTASSYMIFAIFFVFPSLNAHPAKILFALFALNDILTHFFLKNSATFALLEPKFAQLSVSKLSLPLLASKMFMRLFAFRTIPLSAHIAFKRSILFDRFFFEQLITSISRAKEV